MRPGLMYGTTQDGELVFSPLQLCVPLFQTERGARDFAADASRKHRKFTSVVKVWMVQHPSLIYRKLEESEREQYEGAEWIVGA